MRKLLCPLLFAALAMSCSTGGQAPDVGSKASAPPPPSSQKAVSEQDIGLAPGTVFEQPAQEPIAFNRVDPGESTARPRPNSDFPPVIPHTVEDFETITAVENSCLDCHAAEVAADMDAPAVPASHEVDLRRAPDSPGRGTDGARWVCTSCHVAQTGAAPLVANSPSL